MDLGQKLKQARLDAGLSQRQLCGDEITRNMLSQIENGSARPSVDTLRYLAGRLGKSLSYFLEDDAVTSANEALMRDARTAWLSGSWKQVLLLLERYRSPDPVFDAEQLLLYRLASLAQAENAIAEGRTLLAGELLEALGKLETGYCAPELERRRLMLLAGARPAARAQVCRELPGLDRELLLRARDALDRGLLSRCASLLDAVEDQSDPEWNFLRGEQYLAIASYEKAAACYHRAETAFPQKCAPRLELCYRQLQDFRKAYHYACLQRAEQAACNSAPQLL